MSDVDLLRIQQAKYPMDMPTNGVRRPAVGIPFGSPHKMCICFEREKCAHRALDVSSTSNLCRCLSDFLMVRFLILEHMLHVQM